VRLAGDIHSKHGYLVFSVGQSCRPVWLHALPKRAV
jgi:hypothetical protein